MPSTIYLRSGATEATISSAFAGLTQGGTLVLPKDEIIRISKGLDIDTSKRDITLDLNGSTLKQAGDVSVINAGGKMAKASAVDLSFGSTNTTLTYAKAPNDVAVGDWIKVASDDVLPHDNSNTTAPTRLGQAMKVLSVDGIKVTLEGQPLYAELYKTNVRAAEIKSETFSVVNGTVEGDRSHSKWLEPLVYVRNGIDTHVENLTVKDGNSMGINLVNNVHAHVIDSAVMNLRDNTAIGQYGYGVHSAMSLGTTVIGLYGERVRHVTDDNGVGIKPNQQDLSKYGADIGMTVKDTVAYNNSAFSYSWHSEGNQGVLDNVMSFDSHGFVGLRGVGNKVLNSASVGDERGLQFFEYGDGDARDMVVDRLFMKGAGLYVSIISGTTTNNVISNSYLEYDYRPGLIAPTKLVNTVVTMTDGNDNDTMIGTASADRLLGGRGTDLLKGNEGDDYLWGGAGIDTLTGGSGQDRFAFHQVSEAGDIITDFRAGSGGDVLDLSVMDKRYEWHGDIFQEGYVKFVQSGADTLLKVDANGGGDGFVTLATLKDVSAGSLTAANVQTSMLADGTGYVSPPPTETSPDPVSTPTPIPTPAPATPSAPVSGTAAHLGTGGSDYLQGSSGNDILKGLAGNDHLLGKAKGDVLEGGTGSDTLVGGSGSDTASYASATTAVKASLYDASTNLGEAKGDIYYGVENLLGSAHADLLQGNGSMNVLAGGAGDDTLSGMSGMDTLWGGTGNDRLYGGSQNDQLVGGLGKDVLIGGADRDTFVFQNAAEGGDTLVDFVHAFDKIQLGSAFGFADTAHVNFVDGGNEPFQNKATLLYDQDTGVLSFDADGSGSGDAVVLATLSNHAALTASDFVV